GQRSCDGAQLDAVGKKDESGSDARSQCKAEGKKGDLNIVGQDARRGDRTREPRYVVKRLGTRRFKVEEALRNEIIGDLRADLHREITDDCRSEQQQRG